MSLVYIVGNVIKDVYLKLDERGARFEVDEVGTSWLDLAFNGSSHDYIRRSSVFGGARIMKEVLCNFGIDARLTTNEEEVDNYRYVICKGEEATYLTPSRRSETTWKAPADIANWLFLDRSAKISADLVREIKAYLSLSGRTRLAVFISSGERPRTWTNAERELLGLANLVFSDGELPEEVVIRGVLCRIGVDFIQIGNERRFWQVERTATLSHLTEYSIIAGSILGALLNGKSIGEALDFAKVNVENSKLNETLEYAEMARKVEALAERRRDLPQMAKTLMSERKGILAADESAKSIHTKFSNVGIEDSEKNRRDYRNLFFSTPNLEKYLSGVILFDETTHQLADNGRDFVSFLTNLGIVPGIKVDQGLEPFPAKEVGTDKALETDVWTKGLDGLNARLREYYNSGLRFAKWRAAFRIDASMYAVQRNAEIMASYAKACQEEGLVPIVEPELLLDGDYNIEDSAIVTAKILGVLFDKLIEAKVDLAACILKVNMVISGKQRGESTPEEVGEWTAKILKENIPKELAGVVFLSGGQTPEQATANLAAILARGPYPWPVTFSFARAFQEPALEAWKGDNSNKKAAQEAFLARLKANTAIL